MRLLLFIGILFCSMLLPFTMGYAQEVIVNKSSVVEQFKGKPYYVHFVKQGETLLAISKAYQVSIEEIQAENPSLQKGLQYDMALRIPKYAVADNKNTNKKSDNENAPVSKTTEKPKTYTVEKKETLYGISRKFEITVDELLKANPNATILKEGMVLVIPEKTKSETTIKTNSKTPELADLDLNAKEVTVKAGETLYSIAKLYRTSVDTLIALNPELVDGLKSGMVLRLKRTAKVPVVLPNNESKPMGISEFKKPTVNELDCFQTSNIENTYNIALLLPFALEDVMDQNDDASAAQASAECFRYYPMYAGFMMAVDSLQRYGLHAKIYVYDADKQNDTLKLRSVLRKPEMQNMNLIIGPLYATSFPIAARFAQKHGIPIVNPLSQRENLVRGNPFVIKTKPSDLAVADKLAAHIVNKYSDWNVVAVRFDEKENSSMLKRFSQKINQLKEEKAFRGQIVEVNMGLSKMAGVIQALDANKKNIVIYFSDNKSSVPSFISLLNAQKGDRDVSLIGMEEWSEMELETEFLVDLNFEQVTFSNIDYTSDRVIDFTQQYRTKYKAKPQSEQYAFLGFDMGWYYLTSLMWYGKDFQNCMQYNNYKGLEYNFDFRNFKEGDGMQNASVHILKLVDYKMVEVE